MAMWGADKDERDNPALHTIAKDIMSQIAGRLRETPPPPQQNLVTPLPSVSEQKLYNKAVADHLVTHPLEKAGHDYAFTCGKQYTDTIRKDLQDSHFTCLGAITLQGPIHFTIYDPRLPNAVLPVTPAKQTMNSINNHIKSFPLLASYKQEAEKRHASRKAAFDRALAPPNDPCTVGPAAQLPNRPPCASLSLNPKVKCDQGGVPQTHVKFRILVEAAGKMMAAVEEIVLAVEKLLMPGAEPVEGENLHPLPRN